MIIRRIFVTSIVNVMQTNLKFILNCAIPRASSRIFRNNDTIKLSIIVNSINTCNTNKLYINSYHVSFVVIEFP